MSISAFLAAIEAGDDDETEQRVSALGAAHEVDLLARLPHADPETSWWVVRALAQCGSEQSVPLITEYLTSPDAGLRCVAALTLSAIYPRLAQNDIPTRLTPLLGDEDGFVRQTAADALAQCGNDAITALAAVLASTQHAGARSRAAGALRKIGSMETVPVLYPYLNDENHLVRTYVYEALDALGVFDNVLVTFR